MSIIEDRLSTTSVPAEYLIPDNTPKIDWLIDYERGPLAINNTSEGNLYQNWRLDYEALTGNFVLTPETVGTPVVVLTVMGVKQCTFTFDQNARPTLTYMIGTQGYHYWYDSLEESFVTTILEPSVNTPCVTLDDKRAIHVDRSDVLLLYTKNMGDGTYNFFYKQQRDRFTIERLLATNVPGFLKKFGMHQGLRVQFSFVYSEVL